MFFMLTENRNSESEKESSDGLQMKIFKVFVFAILVRT